MPPIKRHFHTSIPRVLKMRRDEAQLTIRYESSGHLHSVTKKHDWLDGEQSKSSASLMCISSYIVCEHLLFDTAH